jgi:hypothetical protein
MPFWSLFVPTPGRSNFCKCLKGNGGDDETRTRDLCRDRRTSIDTTRYRMSLLIVPLLYPDRALSTRPATVRLLDVSCARHPVRARRMPEFGIGFVLHEMRMRE